MGTALSGSIINMSSVIHLECFFLLFSCFSYAVSQTVELCGGGYTHTTDGQCYAYVDKPESWFDAQSLCRATGGFLAEIQDVQQNDLMKKLLSDNKASSHIWLGGDDPFQEGKWFWAHSGIPVDNFTDWHAGQPDDANSGENCLQLHSSWKQWNDGDCDIKVPFVCQKLMTSEVIG